MAALNPRALDGRMREAIANDCELEGEKSDTGGYHSRTAEDQIDRRIQASRGAYNTLDYRSTGPEAQKCEPRI